MNNWDSLPRISHPAHRLKIQQAIFYFINVEEIFLHKHVDAPDWPANAQGNTSRLEAPLWCQLKILSRENKYSLREIESK